MEKRKIDMSQYADMHTETEIVGKDGTTVTVRNHIPYAEKEKMATEMAKLLLIAHDESCIYVSSEYEKYAKYYIAKYYTDIETDGAGADDVADYLINNEMWGKILNTIQDDYEEVHAMFWNIEDAVVKTYEDDRSLTKAFRTSFGFLFTGEDISESLAKAEGVSSILFDAIGALRNAEKEKEEKIDHGTLNIGGNVINFAKKQE